MAVRVQRRRGTTVEHASFVGAVGEVTVDTTDVSVLVHDGVTPGGVMPRASRLRRGVYLDRPATGQAGDVYVATDQGRLYVFF